MATHYYGINAGKNIDTAVVDSSTSSVGVEVVVDDSKVINKHTLLNALENLSAFITSKPYPPL